MKRIVSLLKREGVKRIFSDFDSRTLLFAALSLIINIAYAIYSLFNAFFGYSLWHFALSVYYVILAAERSRVLFAYSKKDKRGSERKYLAGQLRIYRRSGILMIVLHILLSGAMAELVFFEKRFRLPGPTLYISAIYAIYKISSAVYNIFRAAKSKEPAILAVRSISLADASVSALALETVLVSRFPLFSSVYRPINAIGSAFVSIFTVSLGIYTVISASIMIRRLK